MSLDRTDDIALFWREWGADIRAEAGDLSGENDLTTAVILSLFCDARAKDDDVIPDGTDDRRGWWADTVAPLPATGLNVEEDARHQDRLGSRLWLLSREKQLPEALRRAEDYAQEALRWMIADGVAAAVTVVASNPRQGWLRLDISIALPDGRRDMSLNYQYT